MSEEQNLTKVSTWRDLLESGQAEAKLKEIADIDLPCIINSAKGRTKTEKNRIHFAQKHMAIVLANFGSKYQKYRPESRNDAIDELQQKMLDIKPIWGTFECGKWQGKEKKEKKS